MKARLKKLQVLVDRLLEGNIPRDYHLSLVDIRELEDINHGLHTQGFATTINSQAKAIIDKIGFKTVEHGIGWKIAA